MKNDLISREDLRIEIKNQIAYYDAKSEHQSDREEVLRYLNTSYGLKLALLYIDNAPTIVEADNENKEYLDTHIDEEYSEFTE